jgi:hypothetical protein
MNRLKTIGLYVGLFLAVYIGLMVIAWCTLQVARHFV